MTTVDRYVGADWAGDGWLAVTIQEQEVRWEFESTFGDLWESLDDPERVLVDVPIGLPVADDECSLDHRERLDSRARSESRRSSSVFPVPARQAVEIAYEGSKNGEDRYEETAEANEEAIGKGLSTQSFSIAAAIGEVDAFLDADPDLAGDDIVVEAHPELCFAKMNGEPLQYSKKTAVGIGERIDAMGEIATEALGDGESVAEAVVAVAGGLGDDAADVEFDDVVDAFGLALVATRDKLPALDGCGDDCPGHGRDLPMQMVYWEPDSMD